MGIIADMKAFGAIQKIKRGGTAKLSVSQVVNVLINLSDAANKLSNAEYIKVYALYKEMRKSTIQIPLNMNMYLDTAVRIILEFDKIAPYEKYSGGGETEYSFMMADIYGHKWDKIRALREDIAGLEQQIAENDKSYAENSKLLKEAFSDDDLKRMVARGEFPADRVDEYIEQRENLAKIIRTMPATRKKTVDLVNEMRKQLAEIQSTKQIQLEPVQLENKVDGMKKGKTRIITGCVLLILQLMAMSSGNAPGIYATGSLRQLGADIVTCLGYYGPGICGLVLLCLGLKAYCSDDKTVVEESVNVIPAPELQTVPVSIVPEERVPAFVAPPRPETPYTYGGGVVKHDTHSIAGEYIADAPIAEPEKSKQRFCKYCGGAIDPTTKECSKCGKPTYLFKIKKSTVWVILAVLLIGYLVALNVFQYLKYQELKELSYDLEEQCQSLNELAGYYDDIIDALDSNELGEASSTFKSSRHYMVVGADEEDRRFTLTAHDLDEDSITVSYSSDAAKVSFDEDEWKKKVNVEVIPRHPGVTVVTFEDDKSGDSFAVLIIVTE